ncbi:MAG: response regulator [Labilithrix sp.]|nr:response regulator [Labilithrix sp.]
MPPHSFSPSVTVGARSADEILEPVRKMFAELQRSSAIESAAVEAAFGKLTEMSAAALGVARASVWRFGADRSRIECLDLFEAASARHSTAAPISSADFPRYFAGLESERTIAAHEARLDPRTNELDASYLTPHRITAMLDAPIWLAGRLVGVVCHEHVGDGARIWAPWEQLLAGTIADFASLILGAAERAEQRAALERAAGERERLLDSVFAAAPFGLAFYDAQGRYTRVNDWLARVNGRTSAEVIGRRPSEVSARPDLAAVGERLIAEVLASGEPSEVIEMSDGRASNPRTFLVSFYPVVAGDTQVGCCVVEITDQRASEAERATLLERERAARQEAEAASRAKDEFFSVLGHELRNPLAPIKTALHLMRNLGDDAALERAVIERQVDHLGRLVDDMLDVARVTRGKLELRRKAIELAVVVGNGVELASPLLDRRGHALVVDVPAAGLAVDGDPARLAQVVANLLTNAAKFTPIGGRVEMRARREGADVVLSVRDTGAGIAPELMPRLFEAFVQGERRLDRSQGGLGLGLAIVRGIVVAHGGSVSAKSDGAGKGSELVVRLPAFMPPADAPAEVRATGAAPKKRGGRRVLVVDDNEDLALMLARALERSGHEVMTAYDGPTALAVAETFLPEAALVDLGLPVMDGFEVARRLRALPRLGDIKLVAITGYCGARDRSVEAGFDEHLVKPIGPPALERLIADLFGREHTGAR